MKNLLCCALICIFCGLLAAGNPVSVPIDHPIYRFLDRMETLGFIGNLRDGIKPLDRERISNFLKQIRIKRTELTEVDRQRLDNFLLDFRYEIDRSETYEALEGERNWHSPLAGLRTFKKELNRFLEQRHPEEENHVILWEDSLNSFYFDFIADYTFDRRSDDVSRSKQSETYRFRGTIGDNFGYLLDVSFYRIFGDTEYRNAHPVLKNTYRTDRDNQIYFDRSGGDLAYRSPFIDFRFANRPTTWGLGQSGKLILSDNVEQYAYLSMAKHWSWGSFVFMHGKLLAEKTGVTDENQAIKPDKWLVVNRFEFSPFSRLCIGLTDIIVYGNRSVEWAYLVPFNYFRATEHNLGDRDNALLAVDAEYTITNGMKLYGTVLIDELKSDELFSDWYGNKHGFQIGTHIVDPFHIDNVGLRFEYVAIMPWVYTHKYDVNRYINDGLSLGHWAGPNSQVFFASVEKEWHFRFTTGLSFLTWKKGENFENENIGGDILIGHDELLGNQTEAREIRKFLEGILRRQMQIEFSARYEVLNDLFLDLRITNYDIKESDKSIDNTEFHFGIKFDY
jgi:hypothetical protein